MNVVEEKTLLAKLMATENIHVVHKSGARTARFNLKTRTLTCPVWKDMNGDLYDLLMGHEISHALHTPPQGWHDVIEHGPQKKAFRSFLNIIEDARIERFLKEKFPGIRKPMMNGYKTLLERDFFGTSKIEDLNKDLYLIDKINIAAKLGSLIDIKFKPEEQHFFDRTMTVHTWEEVATLALELFEYSKKEQEEANDKRKEEYRQRMEQLRQEADEEEQEKQEEWGDEDSEESEFDEDGEGEEDSGDESEEGGSGESDEDGESSGKNKRGQGDNKKSNEQDGDSKDEDDKKGESSSEEQNDGKDKKDGSSSNGVSKGGASDGNLPRSLTDESYRKKEEELVETGDVNYVNVTVPKVNLKDVLVSCHTVNAGIEGIYQSYPQATRIALDLYRKFKEKNNDYINLLVKEFEMKKAAKAFKRRKLSDTGEIDAKKLPFYKLSDDIFRKMMQVQAGKSHGLTLVLDKSGSMSNHIIAAMEQLLILAVFCRKVNIPFVGFTFTNTSGYAWFHDFKRSDLKPFSVDNGDLRLSELDLREVINSTMNQTMFTKSIINQLLISHLLGHSTLTGSLSLPEQEKMGGTPLNEALIVLRDVVQLFKKKHRIDIMNTIIVHDGDASSICDYYTDQRRTVRFTGTDQITLHDKKECLALRFNTQEYRHMTKTLMKWFQLTTGSGIYGFFIVDKRHGEFRDALNNYYHNQHGVKVHFNPNNSESVLQFSKLREKFIEEKYLESHTPGYNGFFFIPGSSDLSADGGLIADTGKAWTPGRLLTAFIKAGKKQQFSRVLVGKFINMIATERDA